VQGGNQIQDFLDILRRRAWQIVLPALVGVALGNAVATLVPRRYKTMTQLELRETNMPATGEGKVAQGLMRDVATAEFHIKATENVRRVIEKLEWQDFTSLTTALQSEYLRSVQQRIQVKPIAPRGGQGGSAFINITYTDTDPERAQQFVNRLRDAYTTEIVERYRNDARAARDALQNRLALAQEAYRDKERLATELRRKHGLSNTQQAPGSGRQRDEDPVFTQLNQARNELTSTTVKLTSVQARLEALRKHYAEAPREVPQVSISGGLDYDGQLAKIEAAIEAEREKQVGLKQAHSAWQRAEAEIQNLEEKREQLLNRSTRPDEDVRLVANPRRAELMTEIQAQELVLTELQAQRDQLTKTVAELSDKHAELSLIYREIQQLDNEVARAKDNFNEIAKLYDRQRGYVETIDQPHANPFIVSEEAAVPRAAASPNELLILAVGLLGGLALGLVLAVVGEFGHNGYRSVADITRALSTPVLGAVNAIVTREEARRASARKLMVTASTLILAGAIVWVTWAYESSPSLLGSELTRFIDDLRMQFR
jgi:uncharacterized protein involved in exopolysaccharide biosynthesis